MTVGFILDATLTSLLTVIEHAGAFSRRLWFKLTVKNLQIVSFQIYAMDIITDPNYC